MQDDPHPPVSMIDDYTQKLIDHCGGADAALDQCLELFALLYQRAGALLMDEHSMLTPEAVAKVMAKPVRRRIRGRIVTIGPALCDLANEEGDRLQITLLDALANPFKAIVDRVHEDTV